MKYQPAKWARLGLLVAIVIAAGLLQTAPQATQAQGGTLTYGAKVSGAITEELPRITYSFPGTVDDVVTITVENWSGTLDLRAELIAPNGLVLDSSVQNTLEDNLLGAYLSAVLPEEGIYLVRLSGEEGTTGEFALTLFGRAAASSTPLIFGQAVDVIIPQDTPPQFFSFEAEECPTTLLVTNLSEGQPFTFPFVVKVHDQRGQPVAFLRGGEQLEDWVTVAPRSGRYEVEVAAADPALSGSVRLLVTCSGGAPGCVAGQAGIPGVVTTIPTECAPCPGPDELIEDGGCPDLHFTLEQMPHNPFWVKAAWEPVAGATGYAVYVYGSYPDGGEVYLTHAEWVPGDPTEFQWIFPDTFSGLRFVLRVYIGDDLVCLAEASLAFETPPDERLPVCLEFEITATAIPGISVTVEWSDYPGADGYEFGILDAADMILPGYPIVLPPDQLSITLGWLEPPLTFVVGPWDLADGMYCPGELHTERQEIPDQDQFPCLIHTDRVDVRARVGPGVDRGAFAFLTPGIEYPVIGQALDGFGNLWWQIDKTLVPGHEMVLSLWVDSREVIAVGDCDEVPPGDVPPFIPAEPFEPDVPDEPDGPGTWLPCGSCDTCGQPASECVTSPEGECLWDPATCREPPPPTECYSIRAAVDNQCQYSAASAMIDVAPNCDGGYLPGTTISAHAVAVDPKCSVDYWSGCGVSGGGNSITFTATGSCTVTAHMGY